MSSNVKNTFLHFKTGFNSDGPSPLNEDGCDPHEISSSVPSRRSHSEPPPSRSAFTLSSKAPAQEVEVYIASKIARKKGAKPWSDFRDGDCEEAVSDHSENSPCSYHSLCEPD